MSITDPVIVIDKSSQRFAVYDGDKALSKFTPYVNQQDAILIVTDTLRGMRYFGIQSPPMLRIVQCTTKRRIKKAINKHR